MIYCDWWIYTICFSYWIYWCFPVNTCWFLRCNQFQCLHIIKLQIISNVSLNQWFFFRQLQSRHIKSLNSLNIYAEYSLSFSPSLSSKRTRNFEWTVESSDLVIRQTKICAIQITTIFLLTCLIGFWFEFSFLFWNGKPSNALTWKWKKNLWKKNRVISIKKHN